MSDFPELDPSGFRDRLDNVVPVDDGTLTVGDIMRIVQTGPLRVEKVPIGTAGQALVTDGATWAPGNVVTDAGATPSMQANTRANQPAAGTAGRLYVVTDELVLERDDGNAWNQILDLTHRNNSTNPHSVTHAQVGAPSGNPHGVTAAEAGAVANAGGAPSYRADTRANQPTAGTAGRFYYVTDENVLEFDDGAAWVLVFSGTYGKSLAHDSVWLAPGRNSGQATLVNERMTLAPVYIGATGQTITNLGVIVESAGETDSVIRLGVYANNDSNGKPGALLLDAGTVASDTTGRKTIATSLDVAAQWVWLAAVQQGASSTPCDATTWDELTWGMSLYSMADFDFGYYAWRTDNVSGALPDPANPSRSTNRAAAVLAEV